MAVRKTMHMKKKAIGKFAKKAALKAKIVEQEEETLVLKRPAAATVDEPVKKRPAMAAPTEEDVVAGRKAELKSMLVADLKDMVCKKGLEKGTKEAMIELLLKQESDERAAELAAAAKRKQVIAGKRKELEAFSLQSLKDLCVQKGLKSGGTKGDKVDRLVIESTEKGEIDSIIAGMARAERREELSKMSKEELHNFCQKSQIDPIVKEVMVERILIHEAGVTL